ncbi:hypothetical protein U9M48_004468 [Paspalum notatum var. saurae]|uniref:Uncharacterized protein n=1 Tax=Paspalum notatum var. saurae TaxID=547442 RepID=A0AAQ3PUU7_PASNO
MAAGLSVTKGRENQTQSCPSSPGSAPPEVSLSFSDLGSRGEKIENDGSDLDQCSGYAQTILYSHPEKCLCVFIRDVL